MRSGPRKVTKSVRGKKGMVRRSYWVADHKTSAERLRRGLSLLGSTTGAKVGARVGATGGGIFGALAAGVYAARKKPNLSPNDAIRTVGFGMGAGIIGGHTLGGAAGAVSGHFVGKKLANHLVRKGMSAKHMNMVGTFSTIAGMGVGAHFWWNSSDHVYKTVRALSNIQYQTSNEA